MLTNIGNSILDKVAKVLFGFEEDSQSDFTFGTSAFTFGSDQNFIWKSKEPKVKTDVPKMKMS